MTYFVRVWCSDCYFEDPQGCLNGSYGWVHGPDDSSRERLYRVDEGKSSRTGFDTLAAAHSAAQFVEEHDPTWCALWESEIVDAADTVYNE